MLLKLVGGVFVGSIVRDVEMFCVLVPVDCSSCLRHRIVECRQPLLQVYWEVLKFKKRPALATHVLLSDLV